MDFVLDDVHEDLASSIDALLTKADVPGVARAWAAGDRGPAMSVYAQLAEVGVFGLLVDDAHGGVGAGAVEMVVAMEQLGRHAVPGPLVESLAVAPTVLATPRTAEMLPELSSGAPVTLAVIPGAPLAADTAAAARIFLVVDDTLHRADPETVSATVDPTRTASRLRPGEPLTDGVAAGAALGLGALATAAQLIGLGGAMLTMAADYAQARQQFGRPVGSFQAVKHQLADVAIALEMARPLVLAAALGVDGAVPAETQVGRDISAAKVAAADAARLAAHRALQVCGAIGYTAEHDLSLYLTKSRALIGAWGTPGEHRARILETL